MWGVIPAGEATQVLSVEYGTSNGCTHVRIGRVGALSHNVLPRLTFVSAVETGAFKIGVTSAAMWFKVCTLLPEYGERGAIAMLNKTNVTG